MQFKILNILQMFWGNNACVGRVINITNTNPIRSQWGGENTAETYSLQQFSWSTISNTTNTVLWVKRSGIKYIILFKKDYWCINHFNVAEDEVCFE